MTCTGTTRAGKQCKAAALKGTERCAAHPLSPDSTRFGSPEQASRAGAQGGRPPRPRVVDVLRERIEEDMEPTIAALVDALEADRSIVVGAGESAYLETVPDHDVRIKAARELLDRAYGRPRQNVEVTGEDGGPIQHEDTLDLRRLSDEDLEKLEEIRARAAQRT